MKTRAEESEEKAATEETDPRDLRARGEVEEVQSDVIAKKTLLLKLINLPRIPPQLDRFVNLSLNPNCSI